jgi:hypothetical protein
MDSVKPFVGQLIRLGLIIGAILGGCAVIVRLPMVAELQRVPGIGVSARDLITALAYVAVLALLVGFARNVDRIMDTRPDGFPWQTLITHVLILAGVVFAYGRLRSFAASLLGRDNYWLYSVVLLLLAIVPIFGIGKLLYAYASNCIERWEA